MGTQACYGSGILKFATVGRYGTQIETWDLQYGAMRVIVDDQQYGWDRTLNDSCNTND